MSENQAQWGLAFTDDDDDDLSLDDFDDRERRAVATVVSFEPVTCRMTRPPLRTAIDANDIVGRGRAGGRGRDGVRAGWWT